MDHLTLSRPGSTVSDAQEPTVDVKVNQEEMDQNENRERASLDEYLGVPKKKQKKAKTDKKGKKGKKGAKKIKERDDGDGGGGSAGDGSDGKAPSDWKSHCRKDRAWCEMFIDNMRQAGKIKSLFPGGRPPKIPNDEKLKMQEKCAGSAACMKDEKGKYWAVAARKEADRDDEKLKEYGIIGAALLLLLLLLWFLYCCCCMKSNQGTGGAGGEKSGRSRSVKSRRSTDRKKKSTRRSKKGGREIIVMINSRKSKKSRRSTTSKR